MIHLVFQQFKTVSRLSYILLGVASGTHTPRILICCLIQEATIGTSSAQWVLMKAPTKLRHAWISLLLIMRNCVMSTQIVHHVMASILSILSPHI